MADDELGYGSLGKNRKATSERAPGYTGKITFKQSVQAGDIGYLAAWLKKGDDGHNYFSLKLTEPNSSPKPAISRPSAVRSDDPLADDDLPY